MKICGLSRIKNKIKLIDSISQLFITVCILFLLIFPVDSFSKINNTNLEYKVKAAYLYNFTKFVKWPEDILSDQVNKTINLCILGQDPFGESVKSLINKSVNGHDVNIKYINNIDNNFICHLIYISKSKTNQVSQILKSISNKNILTVSDIDNFAEKGGCISLVLVKGKVKFDINLNATQNANIKVSAKLLELAVHVIEK